MEKSNILYNSLLAEQSNGNRYQIRDVGCGMEIYWESVDGYWRSRYLVNTQTRQAYEIVNPGLTLMSFTLDDILMDEVEKLENSGNARRLSARYGIDIYRFENNVAYVEWTLYPDGRYFMDEDGFGMEPNDETVIGAYIDTGCRVLVKFQDMRDGDKKQKLRIVAEELARKQ